MPHGATAVFMIRETGNTFVLENTSRQAGSLAAFVKARPRKACRGNSLFSQNGIPDKVRWGYGSPVAGAGQDIGAGIDKNHKAQVAQTSKQLLSEGRPGIFIHLNCCCSFCKVITLAATAALAAASVESYPLLVKHGCCTAVVLLSHMLWQGQYYEASCESIDPVKKELTAAFPAHNGDQPISFTIKYDLLFIGVSRPAAPLLAHANMSRAATSVHTYH